MGRRWRRMECEVVQEDVVVEREMFRRCLEMVEQRLSASPSIRSSQRSGGGERGRG